MNNRNQKSEIRSQKSEVRRKNYSLSVFCLLFSIFYLLSFPSVSQSVMKGLPEGKPRVEIGDTAPMDHPKLIKARETGKAIVIMFGNPDHCIYCEKVWGNIRELIPKYENDIATVLVSHRGAKFWEPVEEDVLLGQKYGVIGEPWLFLIDKKGIVRQIFAGLTGLEQIEAGLKNLVTK